VIEAKVSVDDEVVVGATVIVDEDGADVAFAQAVDMRRFPSDISASGQEFSTQVRTADWYAGHLQVPGESGVSIMESLHTKSLN
jgi:hypothetical protein